MSDVEEEKQPVSGSHPSSSEVARSSKSALSKTWAVICAVFKFLFWIISLIAYLNILPYIWYFLCHLFRRRQLRKHSYGYGENVVYSASFFQWLGQLFRSEQGNRRRLLLWVQEQIPARKVVDLNRSWSNGVNLCALIEALVPDTCPRFDLLNPEAKVNNCRLGMKLVQRGLGIAEPMPPEVMADARRIQDEEMKRYLLSIQYASQTPLEVPEVPVKIPDVGGQIKLEEKAECTANGSGLVLAVVGKRARFNITTQTYKSKHLIVEICGPSGERHKKKLINTMGFVKGNAPVRQSSKDEAVEGTDIISFDYQCVKTDSYQVNYIPRVMGVFEISITWGGEHINNSPYNIRAALAKNAEPPPPYKNKTVSFQDEKGPPTIPEAVPEEPMLPDDDFRQHPGSLATKGRRQSLVRQGHVTRRGDSSESSGSGTLSTYSSINSSIAVSVDKSVDSTDVPQPTGPGHIYSRQASSISATATRGPLLARNNSVMYGTLDGPARVRTKRKVLRRIIKGAGGKEELIHYPQEQKPKSNIKGSVKAATSGRSSPRSASPQTPKPAEAPQPSNKEKIAVKYGERMSKIILGRAMYEVSKRVIMNNSIDKTKSDEQNVQNQSNASSKTVDVSNVAQNKQKTPEAKIEQSSTKPNIQNSSALSSSTTLKEPQTRSGNKPLVELQQATQEFTPQISRDSDTSNSEREGPLGQEASEQSSNKHKGVKTSLKPVEIMPQVAPKTENEIDLGGTVNRNGPDGQEKGDEEEPPIPTNYGKIDGISGSQSWEAKISEPVVTNNRKNAVNDIEEIKENIAPTKTVKKKIEQGKVIAEEIPKESKPVTPLTKVAVTPNDTQPTALAAGYKPATFKVKRLSPNRPRANKETQCTAQGIKDETGWVSRRTVFQSKQKKDTDNDSALGESRGSSMLASNTDSRDVDVGSWKSVEKESKALKAFEDSLISKSENNNFEMIPFRPRIPSDSAFLTRQRSRSMARQATFDSGFSDEHSHILSSQRSSRDHSNWQSRSASASSAHSALMNTPPGNELKTNANVEQVERILATENKSLLQPTVEQRMLSQSSDKSARTSESDSTLTPPPRLDIEIPSDPYSDAVPSPKVFPQDNDCLTVMNAVMISSTDPTPGNSPLPTPGQLSSPPQSSKSPSPTGDKVDMFSSVDTSASPIAGMSARDIGEKLVSGDMSLDALLQSLEHDPDYSTREFLRKYRPALRDNTIDSLQVNGEHSLDQPDITEGRLSPRPGSSKSTNSSAPMADRCRASGVGLYQGLVNSKNNFQVQTDNAGDGSLGVSIRGPQPHTVVESNVVYTGDDLYEVIYEVNLAGFYVISVKWEDKHIPDSPFIVKVSF